MRKRAIPTAGQCSTESCLSKNDENTRTGYASAKLCGTCKKNYLSSYCISLSHVCLECAEISMDKFYDEPSIGNKNKKKRTGEKKARTKKSGKEVAVELQPQSEPDVVCHDDDTIRPESELKCSNALVVNDSSVEASIESVEKNVDVDVVVNDKEDGENEERESNHENFDGFSSTGNELESNVNMSEKVTGKGEVIDKVDGDTNSVNNDATAGTFATEDIITNDVQGQSMTSPIKCCCGCGEDITGTNCMFKCRICLGKVKGAWCLVISMEGSTSGVCMKCARNQTQV